MGLKKYQIVYVAIIALLVGLNVSLIDFSEPIDFNLGADKELKEWEKNPELKLKASKDKILKAYKYNKVEQVASTTLLGATELIETNEIEVIYSFFGEEFPQEIKEINSIYVNEDISKRRPDYQEFIDSKGKIYHQFRIGDKFGLDENKWKIIEWATTTEEAYEDQTGITIIDKLIRKITPYVYADTFYPYTNGDNSEYCGCSGKSWTTCHGAVSGIARNSAGIYNQAYVPSAGLTQSCIERAQFVFNTSALGSGCTVDSATFSLHGTAKGVQTASAGTYAINVFEFDSSDTTPDSDDYNDCLTTEFSTEITFANWDTTSGRNNSFTLNSAGKSSINTTGDTSLCTLESSYDAPNDPQVNEGCYTGMSGVRTSGTDDDPLLTVTCEAAPAVSAPRGSIIFFD